MRWFKSLLIAFVAFAIVSGIVLCEGSLHVRRQRPLPSEPASVEIKAADGAVLRAWFFQPSQPTGHCVAVLHGIGDTRLGAWGFSPMFLKAGYSVLLPDSRGHGDSGGEITTYGEKEADDAIRWAEWMRSQGCRDVFGLGESLGAAILLEAVGQRPAFDAIVVECPYSGFFAIAEERLARATQLPEFAARAIVTPVILSGIGYARIRYGIHLWDIDPAEAARRSKTPILLIHGVADRRTLAENSRRIAARAPAVQLWLVPGADHVAAHATDPAGFESHVLTFFGAHFGSGD
jgi:dipeptidyl aminopeptidase/acylaminoacyl peptidase